MSSLASKLAKTPWLSFLLLFLFTISVYSPILNSPFKIIDESGDVYKTSQVKSSESIQKLLTQNLFSPNNSYRPITVLSHVIESWLYSRTPFFYYLDNILIHFGSVALVYLFLALLIKDKLVSFLAAAVFALHPLHSQTVGFLSGRADLLNTFFNLGALVACVMYLRKFNGWWLFLSLLSFVLALLSHESRVAMIWTMVLFFLCQSRRENFSGLRRLIFLPYAVVTFLWMALRYCVAWSDKGFFFHGISVEELVNAVNNAMAMATGVLTWPGKARLYLSTSELSSLGIFSVYVSIGIILAAAATLWFYRKKINSVVFFFVGWFVFSLWPVINLFANLKGQESYGQWHMIGPFLYMPSIPLITVLVFVVKWLYDFLSPGRPLIRLLFMSFSISILVVFYFFAYRQNLLSVDETAALVQARLHQPQNAEIAGALGRVYLRQGLFQNARQEFEHALSIAPEMTDARMDLARSLYQLGNFLEALKVYESFAPSEEYQEEWARGVQAIYDVLILNYESELQKNPQDVNAYFHLGVFYSKSGFPLKAIVAYQNVIELDADNASGLKRMALQFQGMIYQKLGNAVKAQENFDLARNLSEVND